MRIGSKSLLARFSERYEVAPNGCWNWVWSVDRHGYGRFGMPDKSWATAPQASYMLHKGEIARGLCVCHTCDNRLCVNPDHLWLGTVKDNHADMVSKGRARYPADNGILPPDGKPGQGNPNAILAESAVLEIRRMAKEGVPWKDLAIRFGVSYRNIQAVVKRRSWAHLPESASSRVDGIRRSEDERC